MKGAKLVGPAKERDLLACMRRFQDAARDAITGLAGMGIELKRIHDDELYLVTHNTWESFARERCELSTSRAYELMRIGERLPSIIDKVKELGIAPPENEWQLRPLLKLTAPQAADVWVEAISKAKEDKVSVSQQVVQEVVEKLPESKAPVPVVLATPPPTASPATTVKPKSKEKSVAKDRFGFDEDEQDVRLANYSDPEKRTLEKIKNLVSLEALEAILSGSIQIVAHDLAQWGTYEDDDFKAIAKYVIEQRWPYPKAHRFLFQKVTSKTKIETLINLANSRGGHARIQIKEWVIDVYQSPK